MNASEGPDWKIRDVRLISVFEVVGSYFVDVFYNGLYTEARGRRPPAAGLGDEYSRVAGSYAAGVQDPTCYGEMVRGAHRWFAESTRLSGISFAEFVDRVVGVCVPAEACERLTAKDKDLLLGTLLGALVAGLVQFVLRPEERQRVVTDRAPAVVRRLQDEALRILLDNRDRLFASFVAPEEKRAPTPAMLDEMKAALRRLAREKADAQKKAEAAQKLAAELAAKLETEQGMVAKLRAANQATQQKALRLLRVVAEQKRTISALERERPGPPADAQGPERSGRDPAAPGRKTRDPTEAPAGSPAQGRPRGPSQGPAAARTRAVPPGAPPGGGAAPRAPPPKRAPAGREAGLPPALAETAAEEPLEAADAPQPASLAQLLTGSIGDGDSDGDGAGDDGDGGGAGDEDGQAEARRGGLVSPGS